MVHLKFRYCFEAECDRGCNDADKALKDFIKAEEERGRGVKYQNGVAAAGLMRRYNKRNPYGGFYREV